MTLLVDLQQTAREARLHYSLGNLIRALSGGNRRGLRDRHSLSDRSLNIRAGHKSEDPVAIHSDNSKSNNTNERNNQKKPRIHSGTWKRRTRRRREQNRRRKAEEKRTQEKTKNETEKTKKQPTNVPQI
jgi:hypothetical protein